MSAVFLFDTTGDLTVFAAEIHASGYMEAIDVDNGEYAAAYLIDGTVLALTTAGENVILRRTETRDLAGLLDAIRAHGGDIGRPANMSDLVAYANDRLRWEWEHRWPRRPRWVARRWPGKGPAQITQPQTGD